MPAYGFDEKDGLLTVTISGMLPPDEAVEFAGQLGARVKAAMARQKEGGGGRVLIDASQAPVQTSASFAEISSLGALFPEGTLPTAVVMGSNLAKMQADRGIVTPNVRVFMSREEALAWLEGASGDASSDGA